MPYDGLFATAIRHELQETLVGSRIDKIFQPTADTLLLHCRQPGTTHKLLLSAHPQTARVHLTTERPDNPLHAPTFCMVLRKHLDPGRIVAVEQQGLDRILRLHIDAFDETGRSVRRLLVAELTGRNSNILLVDETSGNIVDALKRAGSRVNLYRTILPGEPYISPPHGDKLDAREMSAADIANRIKKSSATNAAASPPLLTRLFDGISPFGAREVAARAGVGPVDGPLSDADARALAEALHDMMEAVNRARFAPTLKTDGADGLEDFWLFAPVRWSGEVTRSFPSANEAADAFYRYRVEAHETAALRRLLTRGINTIRKRLERKTNALQKDLDDASRAEQYRIRGELLTANMHLVDRGESTTVPNYYDGGEPMTIKLDPTIGPAANAQRYFRRYTKAKTAAAVVQRQLDATLADTNWLEEVAVHVQLATDKAQLTEIGQELIKADLLPRNVRAALQPQRADRGRRQRSRRRQHAAPSRPIEARIGDGVRVLIGTNSRQNEQVSLRLAQPDDVWLHAKDIAGAHVLLPRRDGDLHAEPDPDLIAEAAALAAYFSKARDSSNVAVDWTLAKHVRKPRGARPGMVIYDNHRTVYVTPDAVRIRRQLAAADG